MRNFLAFLGATVLVVLGLGWYLGWYKVTPQKSGPGQSRLQVDINQEKIGQDVQTGVQKGAEKLQEFLDKNRAANAEVRPGANLAPPPRTDNTLLPPPPAPNDRTTTKPSRRAEEAFRDLIIDGWFGDKK